jgi:Tol biopolymer transport system component
MLPYMAVRVPTDTSQVRAELDRILASDIFARSDRLSAYLRFIVERTLAGEGDTLKEQVIAIELYGKPADFNPAADPIVRVDARRLRDHLREFYATAPAGDVVISMPRGSYTADFTPGVRPPDAVPPTPRTRGTRTWWIAGVGAAAAVVTAWVVMSRVTNRNVESTRLLTVTSMPGAEEDPSLSPDGNFVVFSWGGPNQSLNHDLWVKAVDGDEMRQVTNTPDENERFPRWSPDGQRIAFARLANPTSSVWVVSSLGGPERLVTRQGSRPAWLPDGKSLVFVSDRAANRSSIVRHMLETGFETTLTQAPAGFVEVFPIADPAGTRVAFVRYGVGRTGIFVVPLSGGEPKLIVDWASGMIGGVEWTPDGLDLIYPRPEISGRRLVRVHVDGSQPPAPIASIPLGSVGPSTSRPQRTGSSYRLAFASGEAEIGLRLIDLQAPRQNGAIDGAPFLDVTRVDVPGRFSRDGSQIAFASNRSGLQQVWAARRDQTGVRRVTNFRDATVNVGSWSPDARTIAFNATIAGNTDIYVASVDGGPPRRVTDGPAIESDPEWSRDGRWIYYASNETGRSEIWRMSPDGRERRQLTSEGGFDPHESADGLRVYFVKAQRYFGLGQPTTLEQIPAEGGPSTEVYSGIMPAAWDLAGDRVIFIRPRPGSSSSDGLDVLAAYDLTTGRVDDIGPLAYRIGPWRSNRFLAASPDGRWVVTVHTDRSDRDIYVLDNYR